jgi:hypothetical protein
VLYGIKPEKRRPQEKHTIWVVNCSPINDARMSVKAGSATGQTKPLARRNDTHQ